MPVREIDNSTLNKILVPRLRTALGSASSNGMRRDKLEGIMEHVLKFKVDNVQFFNIMWVVHYETGSNGLYYAVGNVPDRFKKEKKAKPVSAPAESSQPNEKDQFEEIAGDDIKDVRVRRETLTSTASSSAKKKIVKVRIYYKAILLFFVPAGLIVAHLLGKI